MPGDRAPLQELNAPPPNRRLAIEYVSLGQIQPNPKNPRRHKRAAVRKLASSIKALGMNVPVILDAALPAAGPAVSQLGDLWILRNPASGLEHRLFVGELAEGRILRRADGRGARRGDHHHPPVGGPSPAI